MINDVAKVFLALFFVALLFPTSLPRLPSPLPSEGVAFRLPTFANVHTQRRKTNRFKVEIQQSLRRLRLWTLILWLASRRETRFILEIINCSVRKCESKCTYPRNEHNLARILAFKIVCSVGVKSEEKNVAWRKVYKILATKIWNATGAINTGWFSERLRGLKKYLHSWKMVENGGYSRDLVFHTKYWKTLIVFPNSK